MARPEPLIVAIFVFDDAQVAELVRSCVLPSLKLPVAVNCSVWPNETVGLAGVTWIDVRVAVPPEPDPGLLLNAARTAAQGSVVLVALSEAAPLTEVPAKATVSYSLSPVALV